MKFLRSKNSKGGFTLLELIVVISVIAILAAITTIGYSRYQAETRDTRRAASVTAIAETLEKYYDAHGEYPGCTDVTATLDTVTKEALEDIDRSTLIAPLASNQSANSLTCAAITMNGDDLYQYVGDGSSTCTSGGSCLSYSLRYKDETEDTLKTVNGRRSTNIATSGGTTLTRGTQTYITVPLSWTAIPNVTSYTVEQITGSCSGFTSTVPSPGATPFTVTGTSRTMGGLTSGGTYCFRVTGIAGGGQQTASSNTVSATTNSLSPPTLSCSNLTSNSFDVSWPAASGATTYDVEETTTTFTGNPTFAGNTSRTISRTGMTTGTSYFYKARSVTTESSVRVESAWNASSVTCTPIIPAPTSVSIAWTTNAGSTSHSASCAIGAPQFSRNTTYRTDGSRADAWGGWSAYTTGTGFGDFIGLEGMYGKAKVQAKCVSNGVDSAEVESSSIERTRSIDTLGAATWYNRTTAPALVWVHSACPAGSGYYTWGEIYHGSAGYHSAGGWGWGSFELTNGPPNWSMNDGLNAYRISRTVCDTPYWQRSGVSYVRGSTLQGSALTNYNNFVNNSCWNCAYSYSNQKW